MANTVASQTILDGNRTVIQKFTFLCDGSGNETGVVKVDVSTLLPNEFGKACNGVTILKIYAATHGLQVEILWDATTSLFCIGIPTNTLYNMDFSSFGGLPNNAGAGKTGDIKFSTTDAAAGDFYSVTLDMIKSYAS